MNKPNPLLLPSGLHDLLPPDASKEAYAVTRLLSCFESFGYAQVTPPLLEFEATLLSGRGEALSLQTFRVTDPVSHAMMGFRSDMTLQVARIARSRLGSAVRPLRLCYAGPILQKMPEPLRNERQLTQAGIEFIGAHSPYADAEVMIVAAEALAVLGIEKISIDINLPGLLGELCPEALGNPALRLQIKDAITRKDSVTITRLPVANNSILAALMDAAGPLDETLAIMHKLNLPQATLIGDVATRVMRHCPTVSLTLDPIEYRGFDYHQGLSFSIFTHGLRHELGRGGQYMANGDTATGFTLYVTHLLPLLPEQAQRKPVLVPQNILPATARALREKGWATITATSEDMLAEARLLGIKNVWQDGKIVAV